MQNDYEDAISKWKLREKTSNGRRYTEVLDIEL